MTSRIEHAYSMASAGRVAEAAAELEAGGKAGDADCWVELAVWNLEGRIVPRDLARSRECFRFAGETGHARARMIHIALLAQGTGGPRNWQGALELLRGAARQDDRSARELELIEAMALTAEGDPIAIPDAVEISKSPAAKMFAGLLNGNECRFLVEAAGPTFAPSVIVDPASGEMVPHPVRTSDNAIFPWIDETPAIHAINRRMAAASGTRVETGEPLQVLRYRPGQQYRPHHDALPATDNQRVLTMLVYLNSGYSGGETMFMASGLKISGGDGDALLFRNADAQGRPDPAAQHAGLPVLSGEKLIASRWIRERRFGPKS